MRRWPHDAPANITGHAACAVGREPVILRPSLAHTLLGSQR